VNQPFTDAAAAIQETELLFEKESNLMKKSISENENVESKLLSPSEIADLLFARSNRVAQKADRFTIEALAVALGAEKANQILAEALK
jgi:hypothetical protein